uniref:Uncharacterized protein n=1 Tax=Oryza barthii TaxID=65489 RepID=A0A0D3GY44_9ORYZ
MLRSYGNPSVTCWEYPTRICQTQDAVTLQENSKHLENKTPKEIKELYEGLAQNKCIRLLQNKKRGTTGNWEKLLVHIYWSCHKQPKDSVLFGYYTCELLRGDLCYFVHCKCSHKDGLFFDLRRQPSDD